MSMNNTPTANRLHIGIFGKTNSGKSSFINRLTGQEVSIVADVAGTTTDPVYKAMEIHPLGACTIIDTAGFDDVTKLGSKRLEKTRLAAEKTDVAVLVISAEDEEISKELKWYQYFTENHTPVLFIINKTDRDKKAAEEIAEKIKKQTKDIPLLVSAASGDGIKQVIRALTRKIPENYGERLITGNLVGEKDLVMLVMPQDIQAPKGRLILPQVQTTRELLDKKCILMSVTTDQMVNALKTLNQPPKLIITDSQVFDYVYEKKPKESMLTSFSVLFAAYKGDLSYYVKSVKMLEKLTGQSKVLIAECCTHAPLAEDIGRVKIPRMLRQKFGENIRIDVVSGTDFPQDLSGYDLIIQCGACMFNRKYVLSRIDSARGQNVPMTNYGVTIAYLKGILGQVVFPETI